MRISKSIYLSFLTVLLLFASCDLDNGSSESLEQTELPSDVTKLYIEKGNISSNIAVLYSNGGPGITLETDYFDDLSFSEYHEVYVHQTNTYNPFIITGLNENLSFDRAIREDAVSVEMLYRVAKHFKDQGKTVYIVGHSFGAFLIPLFMAEHYEGADKYLIMAGRLDMPELVWTGFRDREGYYFADGVTPTRQNFDDSVSEKEKKEFYARMRLQAGYGQNRYTRMLKDLNMTGRVIYAYGTKDTAVGSLSAAEHDFLVARGADVVKIVDGSHGSMIDPPNGASLKNKLFGTP